MSFNSTPPSIIIADDFPMFRQGVITCLKTRNHFTHAVEADSGIRVIEQLKKDAPCCAVFTHCLPMK